MNEDIFAIAIGLGFGACVVAALEWPHIRRWLAGRRLDEQGVCPKHFTRTNWDCSTYEFERCPQCLAERVEKQRGIQAAAEEKRQERICRDLAIVRGLR